MSGQKERSSLFKFFYVILRILTFPIYTVLFLFRHPLPVLFVLAVAGGGAYYYPLSKGIASDKVLEWYQNKYTELKLELVTKAAESGNIGFIPDAVLNDVKKVQQQLAEEAAEAELPKGENYNAKIVRDERSETTKAKMRKRGGFKKKATAEEIEREEKTTALSESGGKAGGLAGIIKPVREEKMPEENAKEAKPFDVFGDMETIDNPENMTSGELANETEKAEAKPVDTPSVLATPEVSEQAEESESFKQDDDLDLFGTSGELANETEKEGAKPVDTPSVLATPEVSEQAKESESFKQDDDLDLFGTSGELANETEKEGAKPVDTPSVLATPEVSEQAKESESFKQDDDLDLDLF